MAPSPHPISLTRLPAALPRQKERIGPTPCAPLVSSSLRSRARLLRRIASPARPSPRRTTWTPPLTLPSKKAKCSSRPPTSGLARQASALESAWVPVGRCTGSQAWISSIPRTSGRMIVSVASQSAFRRLIALSPIQPITPIRGVNSTADHLPLPGPLTFPR